MQVWRSLLFTRALGGRSQHTAAQGVRRAGVVTVLVGVVASTLLTGAVAEAAVPTTAPAILTPASGSVVEGNPVFTWAAIPTVAKYRMQVSTDPSFNPITFTVDTFTLAATPTTELPLGALFWRVAGLDGTTAGPFATAGFTKTFSASPLLTTPLPDADRVFPTDPALFTWEPLAGAKNYQIEIDDDSGFIGATTATSDSTSYSLLAPQSVGTYFWRVRGKSGSINSAWSETRSYVVTWPGTPTPLTPPNTTATTIEDVVLTWTPVLGAATYQLQVSPNGDFANNVTLDKITKGTQFSPENTTAENSIVNGSYFWRVRARDARAVPGTGPWSEEWRFQRAWTDQPSLLSPTDGAVTVTTPELRWTGIDHASHYEIQMGTDSNFSPGTFGKCLVNQTSYTPYSVPSPSLGGTAATYPVAPYQASTPPGTVCVNPVANPALPPSHPPVGVDPLPGTTYFWRVRGIDNPALPTIVGVQSAVRSFVYRPDAPTMTGPANGASVSLPLLTWEPVSGIGQYQVVLKKANGTAVTGYPKLTHATSHVVVVALNPADGPFRWYVQTRDGAVIPRLGLIQADRTFSMVAPATTVATPQQLTPASGAASVRMPPMTWSPVTGATKYVVHYGVAGSGVEILPPLVTDVPYAGYTHLTALTPNTYEWWVEAKNAGGTTLSSSDTNSTFTLSTLGAVIPTGPPNCEPGQECVAQSETPALHWDHVDGASFYYVYLARDPNFTTMVRGYRTQYNALTPRESLLDNQAGEAYYWFVRPCRTTTQCGAFETVLGSAFAFRKASEAVQLSNPTPGAVVATLPQFSWQEYLTTGTGDQGAARYRIQVSTVSDFSTILDENVVDQTSFAPWTETYPEGPLHWRVQAIDGSGTGLTFSQTRLVTKSSGAPEIITPSAGASVPGTPFFQWAPQPFAARYEVEVYRNGDLTFSAPNKIVAASSSAIQQSAWAPTTSLFGQGSYAWRMRRIDVDSRLGSWTPGRLFTVVVPEATLLTPIKAGVVPGNQLVLDWSAVPGAAQYRVQTSVTDTFGTLKDNATTVMTAFATTLAYTDGAYFWRVQALDAAGNVLSTSPSTALEQSKRIFSVCSSGAPDLDADGFKDACDDIVDVNNASFAYRFVKGLIDAQITAGCGGTPQNLRFCPDATVTRGDMAIFLARSKLGRTSANALPAYTGGFSDVAAADYFSQYVRYLVDNQVTAGCGGGKYCPAATVIRGDMSLFLARTSLGRTDADGLPAYNGEFTDVSSGDYYAKSVKWAKDSGITSGCGNGQFCPGANVTRGQMAIFLVRTFNLALPPA